MPNLTLAFDLKTRNQKGSSFHYPQLAYEVWKWLSKNRSVSCQVFIDESSKFDLDLWPRDPKSMWFFLSSLTCYMWNFKVIGQKLKMSAKFDALHMGVSFPFCSQSQSVNMIDGTTEAFLHPPNQHVAGYNKYVQVTLLTFKT